ncbi:MAG: hypothetical protein WCJ01_11635 [Ignavibacteria bacterium]
MNYCAVLIDTNSIQRYIFGSNKLRENIGASYLVQHIYDPEFIEKMDWQPVKTLDGNYMGYTGGGNALFFFKNRTDAENFIGGWTTELLIYSPGLNTSFALQEITINGETDNCFEEIRNSLFRQLKINKAARLTQTILPTHGITASCSRSGYSAESFLPESYEEEGYFSSIIVSKETAANDALEELKLKYRHILSDKFTFSNNIELLGNSKHKDSHIAVVHIDGNNIGDEFRKCKTLAELKQLSEEVQRATVSAFEDLLQHIVEKFDDIRDEIDVRKEKGRYIIPLRPIILGGDDITFVCDGRLGIYFAKIFMEAFEKKLILDKKPVSSCAGIAVIKLKYPFYRGYQLAEQLCANAKRVRKNKDDDSGSWIDFHIMSGSKSNSLDYIRDRDYEMPGGTLINRPYKLSDSGPSGLSRLISYTKKIQELQDGRPLIPGSRIKELRDVLTMGEKAIEQFLLQLKARGIELPGYEENNNELFTNRRTIYFDMIEFSDVYPDFETHSQGI